MMLRMNENGVLESVDEDDLITVSEKELDELIDELNHAKEEKQQLKKDIKVAISWFGIIDEDKVIDKDVEVFKRLYKYVNGDNDD